MVTERSVEASWVLSQLPDKGRILDIGSCESTYLGHIMGYDVDCIDVRDCHDTLPSDVNFYQETLFDNSLPNNSYDAIIAISTLEHIGMPHYGQPYIPDGDILALSEIWWLLKPKGKLIWTVPCGLPKVTSWYRQYDPPQLRQLMSNWDDVSLKYWGFRGTNYVPINEGDVMQYDYFDVISNDQRAGAVAGITARKTT
jgi:hypothetical protein